MRIKLKYISRINMGQSPEQESVNQEGVGTPFLQGKAEFGETHPSPVNYCVKANKFSMPNDILMSVRAPVGSLNLSDQKYVIGRGLCSITPKDDVDRDYLWYGLIEANSRLLTLVKGSTFEAVTTEDVKNLEIKIPSNFEEQRIISKFLSKKDKKINDLIISKNKLIDLLEQQCQSIITEAVTKGLNPNVKMKDSGVEWIGEIPEHWGIKKIKNIANVYSSNVDKKSVEGEKEVLLCNYVDVYYNDSITADKNFMKATAKDEQIKTFTLKKHDVIITKDSESPKDIAIPTWVSEDLDGVVCGYHLSLIRCFENTLGHYLYYTLESNQIKEQFYTKANGVTRFGLSKEAIKNGLIAIPPFNEQLEIAEMLNNVNQEVRSTVEKLKIQIEKLKEYRQALIYEAVTGKIDVRDMELDEVR
ncbi:restriction endonuclease subunit S [Bacillus altitudinis]|uniref:restriction endonuclease subunit S n=1 Tax=Bacillus altitudinis TaxID=293387 RepID=UPI0022809B30|nr:restriction endonuclease subunit S [Bacillus altitudinis]MCY7690924.1 restriction endonuclease subunit S [Bacillus altitudinis]